MTVHQLNRLLNEACDLLIELEHAAVDEDQKKRIDALFNEIKYSDDLDADMEAQDWDEFGKNKI